MRPPTNWPSSPAPGTDPAPERVRAAVQALRRRRGRQRLSAAAVTAVVVLGGGIALWTASRSPHAPTRPATVSSTSAAPIILTPPTKPTPTRWAGQLPGAVAYMCGGDLCVMRPDGTGLRELPSTGYPAWEPAWSPDGTQLAFRGYFGVPNGDYSVYTIGADGCELTRLTKAPNGTEPTWSPTGDRLAYALGGITVIKADGTGRRSLTQDRPGIVADSDPAWSSSNRIAFERAVHGAPSEIYAVNPDGSGLSALTRGRPGFIEPAWSGDGRQIAYVAGRVTARVYPHLRIDVAAANGASSHPVTPSQWTSFDPTWTPNGKVVFLRSGGTTVNAYVVNPDGTGLHLIYTGLGPVQSSVSLDWGPTSLPSPRCGSQN